jgi:hypothetical protein
MARPLPSGTDYVWVKYDTIDPFNILGVVDTNGFAQGNTVRAVKAAAPMVVVTCPVIGGADVPVSATFTDAAGNTVTGTCTIPANTVNGTRIPIDVTDGTPVVAATDCTATLNSEAESFVIALPDDTYTIDRLAGTFTFNRAQYSGDLYKADYFFGTMIPTPVAANLPPYLSNGKLTPLMGTSGTEFLYSVNYREVEGLNGQAPTYMRVVIDDTAYDMTPTVVGTPSYRAGVTFTYKTRLASGRHSYYFETSDGVGAVTLPLTNVVNGVVDPYLPICLRLPIHLAWLALAFAVTKTGKSIAASIAMIAITTSSSISVNTESFLCTS